MAAVIRAARAAPSGCPSRPSALHDSASAVFTRMSTAWKPPSATTRRYS